MKTKIVLVGMGFLMFIFCSINLSQAAMDIRENIHYLSAPNEHPWQHDDSPRPPESLDRPLSFVVILPAGPAIKAILFIHAPGVPPTQGIGLQRATIFSRRAEQHFNGAR